MELLNKLTQINSPSGRENNIKDFIADESKKLGYDVSFDALGSVIAHKKGNGKKLMLDAHMDEIGIIATYIDENGFIRFGAVGGLYIKELPKRRVRFMNGTIGVIGSEEEAFNEKSSLSKLFIDIGASNKEEAEKYVKTGDTAVFEGEFHRNGDIILSKALDNRAGCYILLKTMKNIKNSCNDLYFVFSAQEEVGLRGAKTAAYSIMPDYAIAVDVTDTGDTPSCPVMDVKLGKGAAIKIMDRSVLCEITTVNTLKMLAENNSIPYQTEIMSDGGTNAGAIAVTGCGVKSGGISLPARYIHSPSEMASVKDINACIELLTQACVHTW